MVCPTCEIELVFDTLLRCPKCRSDFYYWVNWYNHDFSSCYECREEASSYLRGIRGAAYIYPFTGDRIYLKELSKESITYIESMIYKAEFKLSKVKISGKDAICVQAEPINKAVNSYNMLIIRVGMKMSLLNCKLSDAKRQESWYNDTLSCLEYYKNHTINDIALSKCTGIVDYVDICEYR